MSVPLITLMNPTERPAIGSFIKACYTEGSEKECAEQNTMEQMVVPVSS